MFIKSATIFYLTLIFAAYGSEDCLQIKLQKQKEISNLLSKQRSELEEMEKIEQKSNFLLISIERLELEIKTTSQKLSISQLDLQISHMSKRNTEYALVFKPTEINFNNKFLPNIKKLLDFNEKFEILFTGQNIASELKECNRLSNIHFKRLKYSLFRLIIVQRTIYNFYERELARNFPAKVQLEMNLRVLEKKLQNLNQLYSCINIIDDFL